MLYLLGVLGVALGVGVSIALHEIGHLVPAKRSGLRVPQYMVGFGPTVWSRTIGETEYGVKAIPLGGYIRMIGMFPPKPGQPAGTERVSSTGRMSQIIDGARTETLAEVGPGDEDRVFYKLPTWRKLMIMLGGPTMNAVIAAVLFTVIFMGHGIVQATTTVASVSQCVAVKDAASASTTPSTCTSDMPVAPANAAGLKPGDRVVSVAGQRVSTWSEVRAAIRANLDKPLTFVVERDGHEVTLHATPLVLDLPVYDDATGTTQKDASGAVVTERAGFLGASPQSAVVKQPITAVPGLLWDLTERSASVIFRLPQKMVGVVQAAFGDGERDPEGPVSVVGVGRAAGELTAMKEIPGGEKPWIVLQMVAGLNLALFLFNLVPLLPLDGGHVAGALWEAVKRGFARLTHRPDPGYVDVAKALPVAYAVSAVLMVMTVLLVYADLVNPIKMG